MATDGEQAVITATAIATLTPAQHYSDILSAHQASHPYLGSHKFKRAFNVGDLGSALDALMVRSLDGSERIGCLKAASLFALTN